jgi:hypothetical protein
MCFLTHDVKQRVSLRSKVSILYADYHALIFVWELDYFRVTRAHIY